MSNREVFSDVWSRERRDHRRYVFAGLAWGLLTGFAFVIEAYAVWMQAGGLLVAAGVVGYRAEGIWSNVTGSRHVLLLGLYAAVAAVSGLVNASGVMGVLRYGAVFVAYVVLSSVAAAGKQARDGFLHGLLAAGGVLVAYYLPHVHWDNLFDATDRIWLFLNPNAIGFIAAMTAVGLLGGVLAGRYRGAWKALALAGFVAAAVLAVVSMTRMAMLVLLSGVAVLLLLWGYQKRERLSWKTLAWVGLPVAVWLLLEGLGLGLFKEARTITRMEDPVRVLATASERFVAWRYIVADLWPQHVLLGAGPGRQEALVLQHTGIAGAHNGLLMNLADVGLLGVMPLLAVLANTVRRVIQRARAGGEYLVATGLFVGGVVESLGETMFFSIGNPASLLFMMSVAVLGEAPSTPRPAATSSPQGAVEEICAE